jgi:hypothetical protein
MTTTLVEVNVSKILSVCDVHNLTTSFRNKNLFSTKAFIPSIHQSNSAIQNQSTRPIYSIFFFFPEPFIIRTLSIQTTNLVQLTLNSCLCLDGGDD